ncbi:MAG: gliding motility-associated C-terminal domain-containing protein [Saprospiraceae bacterium]|nr:gliding motility-associated C-terminal domain-containing protein [Saprospiraceae bacterium]
MVRLYSSVTFLALLISWTSSLQLNAQVCPITVDAGPDIYICAPPSPVQLNGDVSGDFISYQWTPSSGLSNAFLLDPTANVTSNATYVLTGRGLDLNNNLVDNGDFEGGNSGFSSNYVYSPGDLWPEGVYDVLSDPNSAHTNFASCNDHTGGGNMMCVNGASVANTPVWCETVNVMPNTTYVLSVWLCSVISSSPALLQFSINGSNVGGIFGASSTTCAWSNFYQTWNSGGSSSATICVVNQNTAVSGNDFALDDIVFSPVCTLTDTVQINVVNITAIASPTTVYIPCEGSNVTLSGTGSSTGPDIHYEWETGDGNIVSGGDQLQCVVNAPGLYTLTVSYDANGVVCTKTANVNVLLSPSQLAAVIAPVQPIGCGTQTPTIFGSSNQPGLVSYLWTTADGLILTDPMLQTITVGLIGTYELQVTHNQTGCTATASVTVSSASNPPTAIANGNNINCLVPTSSLVSTGSTTGTNIAYTWSAFNGGTLNGPVNQATATGTTAGSYVLTVINTTNGCKTLDTIVVSSNLTAPMLSISPPGQLNCNVDTVALNASSNPPNINYTWSTTNGNIVAGNSTSTALVTSSGLYTLSGINPANGCTATATQTITIDTLPPIAVIATPDTITCQQSSIVLDGSGASSGPNIQYAWSGGNIISGQLTNQPLVNAASTYTFVVTNMANGCTYSATILVAADTNIVSAVANAPDSLTCTVNALSINANGSSTGTDIFYAWSTTNGAISGNANAATVTVTLPGTYALTVSNSANGCTATDLVDVILDNAPPQLSIATPSQLTCLQNSLQLQGQNSASGAFTYVWTTANGNISANDSTLTPTINAPGDYVLTATNLSNGCSNTATVQVTQAAGVPTAIGNVNGPITCTQPAALSSAGSSSGSPYVISWTTQDDIALSGDNPTVNTAGVYHLLVTNTANGCTSTTDVTVITDQVAPPANAGLNDTLNCFQPQTVLTANQNVTAGLDIIWSTTNGQISGVANIPQINIQTPGDYVLVVTNPTNGCFASDTVQVLSDQILPDVSIAQPGMLTCLANNVNLVANSSVTNAAYAWQGPGLLSGQQSAISLANVSGTYTVTITNPGNGCTAVQTVFLPQNITPPLLSNAGFGQIDCQFAQQNLQASNAVQGAFHYQWSASNGGNIVAGDTTLMATVNAGGQYQLIATNTLNGCRDTLDLVVNENTTPPVVSAGLDDTLTCNISNLILAGSGSGSVNLIYQWTASPGGVIINGINTTNPLIGAPGFYTLMVTNQDNHCTATDVVEVLNDENAPQVNINPALPLTCVIHQVSLQATASSGNGISYQWTAGTGANIVSGHNSLQPVVSLPGLSTRAVSNALNGCTTIRTVNVPIDTTPPLVQALSVLNTLTCDVPALTLSGIYTGTLDSTLLWTTTNGHIQSGDQTLLPIVDQPGDYVLTATQSSNGCSASAVVSIGQDTLHPDLITPLPEILTCTETEVPVAVTLNTPVADYTATWTGPNGGFVNGQTTLTPVVNRPGNYTLTIKNNQNGCISQLTVPVQQDTAHPVAVATSLDKITCDHPVINIFGNGSSTGAQIGYAWSGPMITSGITTISPTVNAEGDYHLVVTNNTNGCTATTFTTVRADTITPTGILAPPDVLTCLKEEVQLRIQLQPQLTDFTVMWTTSGGNIVSGFNTLTPIVNEPGNYLAIITNKENGCKKQMQTLVDQMANLPGAEAGPTKQLTCQRTTVTLQGSSNTLGTQSQWTTANGHIVSGANSAEPVVSAPGLYNLLITNPDNGCFSRDSVVVTQLPLPEFTPESVQPNCKTPRGNIDFGTVTGGLPPYSYSVDNGLTFKTTPVFNNLAPGSYMLFVEDAEGCEDSAMVVLAIPFEPEVTLPKVFEIELGEGTQLMPDVNFPSNQVASWLWTPGDSLSCTDCMSPFANPTRAATYTLVITDQNGCTATARTQIYVDRTRNLYAPNVITPNGDGKHDRFTIYGRNVVQIRSLAVFDRWGNQMFLNKNMAIGDESVGWDGTFRGKEMNPAVFVWKAEIEFPGGEIETYTGDVTIVR